MKKPGANASQGWVPSVACAWYNMFPQLARGGCTPTPKKLSADSSRMPRATASVSETMTACAAFDLREFHERVMSNGIAPWWAHRQLLLPGDRGAVVE